MNVLEELWYGNIDPMEAVGSGGHYYKELMGLMAKNREKIAEKLDAEMQEVLETYDDSIREALLNVLIHRDYSFSGSIIINVNNSKMEFISLGGLLPGLSTEDIRIGISQPRNKKLAEVFHRLRLIESYGTGIRRIYKLYENCPMQPLIEATGNAFKIVLPNMNENAPELAIKPITDQMKKVLAYIDKNGQITDAEIGQLLDIKQTRVYNLAREMCELNLIGAEGRGKKKKYFER